MNFLVKEKRPVYLAFFLLVTLVGYSRWNPNLTNENTNRIPTPNDPKQSNHTIKAPIQQTTKVPVQTTGLISSTTATASPEGAIIQKTAGPLTAPTEALTLTLTPTLTVTPDPITNTPAAAANLPTLADFIHQVSNGQGDLVRGLYVAGVMALRVVKQPPGDPGFISAEDGTATLFQTALLYGVTGLLAHNFLSGREFFRLRTGQALNLIFGDGRVQRYRISKIDDFQRLSVTDMRSNFVELKSGSKETTNQVFADFYQGQPHLTLQTCIERNGEWSWGVRFIKADPIN
jgi:hypothetical protein